MEFEKHYTRWAYGFWLPLLNLIQDKEEDVPTRFTTKSTAAPSFVIIAILNGKICHQSPLQNDGAAVSSVVSKPYRVLGIKFLINFQLLYFDSTEQITITRSLFLQPKLLDWIYYYHGRLHSPRASGFSLRPSFFNITFRGKIWCKIMGKITLLL